MIAQGIVSPNEQGARCVIEAAAGLSALVEADRPAVLRTAHCPVCYRISTVVRVGETLYCAACGYASDGASGCT